VSNGVTRSGISRTDDLLILVRKVEHRLREGSRWPIVAHRKRRRGRKCKRDVHCQVEAAHFVATRCGVLYAYPDRLVESSGVGIVLGPYDGWESGIGKFLGHMITYLIIARSALRGKDGALLDRKVELRVTVLIAGIVVALAQIIKYSHHRCRVHGKFYGDDTEACRCILVLCPDVDRLVARMDVLVRPRQHIDGLSSLRVFKCLIKTHLYPRCAL